MSNLNLICVLQPNVITKFRLLSLLPSGQCINKSYQQNLRKMYIDPEKAKLASFLKTFQIKKPAVAPRQACSSQILYLSNTTKITTNTETAMQSRCIEPKQAKERQRDWLIIVRGTGSQATAPSLGRRAVKPFLGGRRSGTTLSSAWLGQLGAV